MRSEGRIVIATEDWLERVGCSTVFDVRDAAAEGEKDEYGGREEATEAVE